MDFIWIFFAFICGIGAKSLSLPPSIGYLIAGFVLHYLGFEADASLDTLADIGITIMLFTIGLKFNVKDLLKPEVFVGSLSTTAVWMVIGVVMIKLCAVLSLAQFSELSTDTTLLIVFALSFSSTVCVVKLFEEYGEMRTRHGKLAIGILVMQDIMAVAFLVVATGKVPAIEAISLLSVFLLRPLINKIISHVGHGELIPLTGFFIAFGSYELFELVKIKGDLGALLAGMFLANHPKASELTKSLMSFKDIFLIGFFLSIGFTALPDAQMFKIALLFVLLIPIKFVLFFLLLSGLKIRSRTAFLTALSLSNYSEFGLIVAALSVSSGWLAKEWLVIIALAVSISFVITNVIYKYAHPMFSKYRHLLLPYERDQKLSEDTFCQPCNSPVVVIGMGRVGMGAYKALHNQIGKQVWGLDADKSKSEWLASQGYQSYYGDAEDAYFWEKVSLDNIKLILLALPAVKDAVSITQQLKHAGYQGKIAAIARFDDDRDKLERLGIDKVFNFYTEAGVGFAEESIELYHLN